MLIITGDAPELRRVLTEAADWPGPHVVLTHPGIDADLSDLPPAALIYEFTAPPAGYLGAMREIILHAERRRLYQAGPLLLLTKQRTVKVAKMEALARRKPRIVDTALTANDDLAHLLLGPAVVENPLFITFFKNMQSGLGAAYTSASLKILREHLT